MAFPDTPKPASARHAEPASNTDQSFAGEIDTKITPIDLQAQRLRRIFALSAATAATIARLAYAVAR
jgi:hypothetical protein